MDAAPQEESGTRCCSRCGGEGGGGTIRHFPKTVGYHPGLLPTSLHLVQLGGQEPSLGGNQAKVLKYDVGNRISFHQRHSPK